MKRRGVGKADLWDYIKRKYSVESRNDMSEMQWTTLSAELKAAETSPQLLDELCERIKQLTAASQESEVPTPEETTEPETASVNETQPKTSQFQVPPF